MNLNDIGAISFSIGGRPGIMRGDRTLYELLLDDPKFDEGSVMPLYYGAGVEPGMPIPNSAASEANADAVDAARWRQVRSWISIERHPSGLAFRIPHVQATEDMMRGSVSQHFTKAVDRIAGRG